ncbi:triose-phosphate isomerase, partial [Peptococcaceae bacterium]|nr:triose-phosphate isomerase [Peptococcaceae bacterium]
ALKYELLPIICVGETLQQREAGSTEQLVGNQIKAALEGLDAETVSKLIVAYEPVWAIGTGKTASDTDAQKVIAYIRSVIQTQVGVYAEAVRILYGGSVKPANITGLMSQPDIDGALVGGASLEAASFAGIIQGV